MPSYLCQLKMFFKSATPFIHCTSEDNKINFRHQLINYGSSNKQDIVIELRVLYICNVEYYGSDYNRKLYLSCVKARFPTIE